MSYFYTPWKRQKTKDFLTFSGSVEIENWSEKGQSKMLSVAFFL